MPRVSPLFLDTLAFTMHVPYDAQKQVIDFLTERSHEPIAHDDADYWRADRTREKANALTSGFSGYRTSFRIPLTAYTTARIGLGPTRTNTNFLRVELSPNKAGEHGCSRLLSILQEATNEDAEVIRNRIRPTRTDWGINVRRAPMDQYLFEYRDEHEAKTVHYFGVDRSHETFQHGLRGHSHLLIYNKVRQLIGNPTSDGPYRSDVIRIEYCLRNTFGISQTAVDNNLLAPLLVWDVLTSADDRADVHWRTFIEAARNRGTEQALSWITDFQRRLHYRRRLHAARAGWWDPVAVWAGLADVVHETRLLPWRM